MHLKSMLTNDGVCLRYVTAGDETKQPIVLVHGGGQASSAFHHQITALQADYYVVALDMRGHGESDAPDSVYTVARLAKDLDDLLTHLTLHTVILLGHSLGCSVIWNYWDLFDRSRIAKLVLIDEPAALLADPDWSVQRCQELGAIVTTQALYEITNSIRQQGLQAITTDFINAATTAAIEPKAKQLLIDNMLKLKPDHIADIFFSNMTADWQPAIRSITVPTLIVGGKASHIPWQSQQWIHRQIKGSRLEIFDESAGGSHFMFIENPVQFNQLLRDFL